MCNSQILWRAVMSVLTVQYSFSLAKQSYEEKGEKDIKLCTGDTRKDRLICCHSANHFHNVMIKGHQMFTYETMPDDLKCKFPDVHDVYLEIPVHDKQVIKVPMKKNCAELPVHECKDYYDGTLYISGRSLSSSSSFRALNDDVLPLMTQIVLDEIFQPEFSELPRMGLDVTSLSKFFVPSLLFDSPDLVPKLIKGLRNQQRRYTNVSSDQRLLNGNDTNYDDEVDSSNPHPRALFSPHHHKKNKHVNRIPPITHVEIYNDLLGGKVISFKLANEMCFRRVVWGTGLRMHYVDAMVVLRRLTADYARAFVMEKYNPPIPPTFVGAKPSHSIKSITESGGTSEELIVDGRPLRVMLISRGSSGKGRTLRNEQLLVDRLRQAGAVVHASWSSDERTPMRLQVDIAVHADVIVGLHGAGLVHGVFAPRGCIIVELKTQYGYQSDIFLRTSDSRQGTHIHIDVRNYSRPGRIHSIDSFLVKRIFKALVAGLNWQRHGNHIGRIKRLGRSVEDYLIGPSAVEDVIAHTLGPRLAEVRDACVNKLVYSRYREQVLGGKMMEFCHRCPRNSSIKFLSMGLEV